MGGVGLPTQHEGGGGGIGGKAPFFLFSLTDLLNINSIRILSEATDKWVFLMWGVRTFLGAIVTDKATKLETFIPM